MSKTPKKNIGQNALKYFPDKKFTHDFLPRAIAWRELLISGVFDNRGGCGIHSKVPQTVKVIEIL